MYVILVILRIAFPIYDDIICNIRNPCNTFLPLAVTTHHTPFLQLKYKRKRYLGSCTINIRRRMLYSHSYKQQWRVQSLFNFIFSKCFAKISLILSHWKHKVPIEKKFPDNTGRVKPHGFTTFLPPTRPDKEATKKERATLSNN